MYRWLDLSEQSYAKYEKLKVQNAFKYDVWKISTILLRSQYIIPM